MKIYNRNDVESTVAKMRKRYKFPESKKEVGRKKTSFFYDLTMLSDNLPLDILNSIIEQTMEQHSTLNNFCVASAISKTERLNYYVYIDLVDYSVRDSQEKMIYRLAQCCGIRVATFKPNCYGIFNIPNSNNEYGSVRQSVINHVKEIVVDENAS